MVTVANDVVNGDAGCASDDSGDVEDAGDSDGLVGGVCGVVWVKTAVILAFSVFWVLSRSESV